MKTLLMNPHRMDKLPAVELVADAPGDELTPAVLVDVLQSELARRVMVAQAAVKQLPDNGPRIAGAVAELYRVGNELAAMGRDEHSRPSRLADGLRRLSRQLAHLEELIWSGVCRAVRGAEDRGDVV